MFLFVSGRCGAFTPALHLPLPQLYSVVAQNHCGLQDVRVKTRVVLRQKSRIHKGFDLRNFDGFEYSDWSETRLFWVNATNSAPATFVLDAPTDSARVFDMLPTFRWQSSADNDPGDSALYKLSVAIDSGFAFVATVDSISDTLFTWSDSLDFGDEYWWKVEAFDANGAVTASSVSFFPTWVLGDANSDGSANIADVTFLINRIFSGGPGPNPPKAGDVNGDCSVNIADVTFLIARIFTGGPPPTIGCAP